MPELLEKNYAGRCACTCHSGVFLLHEHSIENHYVVREEEMRELIKSKLKDAYLIAAAAEGASNKCNKL